MKLKKVWFAVNVIITLFLISQQGLIGADYARIATNAGICGAKFLELPIGGEYVALNFSAQADRVGPGAVAANPAALVFQEKNEFYLSHSFWFQGISYDFVGYSFRWVKMPGAFALAAKFYKTDEIGHTEDSVKILSYFRGTGSALYLGYSDYINKRLVYGVSAALISEKIYSESSYGILLNGGIIYLPPREELLLPDFQKKLVPKAINFSINNLGYKTAFISQTDLLPLSFALALKYTPLPKLNMYLGYKYLLDDKMRVAISGSYRIKQLLSLNLGYEYKLGGNDQGFLEGLTSGFSLKIERYRLEYGFKYFSQLGLTNHLSFAIQF